MAHSKKKNYSSFVAIWVHFTLWKYLWGIEQSAFSGSSLYLLFGMKIISLWVVDLHAERLLCLLLQVVHVHQYLHWAGTLARGKSESDSVTLSPADLKTVNTTDILHVHLSIVVNWSSDKFLSQPKPTGEWWRPNLNEIFLIGSGRIFRCYVLISFSFSDLLLSFKLRQ